MRAFWISLVILFAIGCTSSETPEKPSGSPGWDGKVQQWGTLREVMHGEVMDGQVRLSEVKGKPHVFGIGAPDNSRRDSHRRQRGMGAFAVLMIAVAVRMGLTAKPDSPVELEAKAFHPPSATCRFEPSGKLKLTSRCALVLAIIGLVVCVLSGLFGVGGGFVIVPALVLLTGMEIHRAVVTSLLVVALVGLSGFVSHQVGGELRSFGGPLLPFIGGGVPGLEEGSWIAHRLPAFRLQQVFAIVIIAVAVMML